MTLSLTMDFACVMRYALSVRELKTPNIPSESAELQKLMADVWDAGYEAGLSDGIDDCTVEQAHRNPYRQ